jgi:hypothetical protein
MDVYLSTPRHPRIIAHIDAHDGIVPNETRLIYFDANRLQFFEANAGGAAIASPGR